MGVTINDIARICGVSRTTVIRALNDTGRISDATKARIRQTAQENGYRPDLLARGLAMSRTYTIGVVVLNVMNQHFAQIVNAVEERSRNNGYSVNIMLHGQDPALEQQQVNRLLDYHVDGIILSSVNAEGSYADMLKKAPVPIVTVDNRVGRGLPFVGVDNRKAVYQLVQKAIRKAYRRLVFVCPPLSRRGLNLYVHEERRAGFLEAVKDAGFSDYHVIECEDYSDRCKSLLLPERGTAFICSGDIFALELMKFFRGCGLSAGTEYGLTGFDGTSILDYVVPRIDTIDNHEKEIGHAAVDMLLSLIEKKDCKTDLVIPADYLNGRTL